MRIIDNFDGRHFSRFMIGEEAENNWVNTTSINQVPSEAGPVTLSSSSGELEVPWQLAGGSGDGDFIAVI